MFLGLANFLVSCEVDKAVLQESWDLDVDSWSRDSCSSLYSISLRGKKGTSGVQQAARQRDSPGTTPKPAHVKAPVSHFTEVTCRWDLRKGQFHPHCKSHPAGLGSAGAVTRQEWQGVSAALSTPISS